jgi:hypothetical protein
MNGPRGTTKWPQPGWALSNFGLLWGVYRTRKQAIEAAEENIGHPWRECRKSMEVWKCEIRPVTRNGKGVVR